MDLYDNEPHGVYFLIDNKSSYASCEAVERCLNPLKVPLAKSFAEQRLVQLQLNILNKNDQFTQNITDFVTGFNTDSIWLTGQDLPIQIQDIAIS